MLFALMFSVFKLNVSIFLDLISPETSSSLDGSVVPIPTNPLAPLIFSDFPFASGISPL